MRAPVIFFFGLAPLWLAGCYDFGSLSDEFVSPDMAVLVDGGDDDGGLDLSAGIGAVTLLAGGLGGVGALDGVGSEARFYQPTGLAYDGNGELYVAEYQNATVRKIDVASGTVTRVAGLFGLAGASDGPVASALFSHPGALALDGDDLWISDLGSSRIRKLSNGQVSTVLGGVVTWGMTIQKSSLYYADFAKSQIMSFAIGADGSVTAPVAFSGTGVAGLKSGAPGVAQFDQPSSIIAAPGGGFLVADQAKSVLRLVDPAGNVSATAPTLPHPATSTVASPWYALAADSAGNVYSANSPYDEIDKVVLPLTAGIGLIGRTGTGGSTDGPAGTAQFTNPSGLAYDGNNTLFVADRSNHTIRTVALDTLTSSTLAGAPPATGITDSSGAAARFSSPLGVVWDALSQHVYVGDYNNRRLRAVDLMGAVSTVIVGGDTDAGVLPNIAPAGVTTDNMGNLYLADYVGNTIYSVDGGGNLIALAGKATPGAVDGTGSAASFDNPRGLAFDSTRNVLYVADQTNGRVRVVTLAGQVTTLSPRFSLPTWVAYDAGSDVLYVADSNNHAIQKISFASNTLTLVAGTVGSYGSGDGPVATAQFMYPRGLALDGAGALYVADYGNSTVRKIDLAAGVVSTLAGVAGQAGARPGPLPARLNAPEGLTWVPGFGLVVSLPLENSLVAIR